MYDKQKGFLPHPRTQGDSDAELATANYSPIPSGVQPSQVVINAPKAVDILTANNTTGGELPGTSLTLQQEAGQVALEGVVVSPQATEVTPVVTTPPVERVA